MVSHRYESASEELLGKYLAASGHIFLQHVRQLPGTPDFVFPNEKLIVQVHGCYWHRHATCSNSRIPISNWKRWVITFEEQVERDDRTLKALESMGWWVFVAWECEISESFSEVTVCIENFLEQRKALGRTAN